MNNIKTLQEQYFNEAQLSKYWNVKQSTLQKWRSAGVGPIYIKRVGKVVYKLSEILKFEEENSFKGSGERAYQKKGEEDGKQK